MPPNRGIRVGVLVLRVWREDEGPDGFRARITATLDIEDADEILAQVVGSPGDVRTAVAAWLDAFQTPAAGLEDAAG